MKTVTCLIDSDIAIDDWMAILYLLQCPLVAVRAITVAATGEAHARPGVNNALRLCALANATHVDVTYGRTTPLQGNNTFPLILRVIMDMRFLLPMPRIRHKASPESAAALLKRHISTAQEKVIIVALGPHTNLAQMFLDAPDLIDRIEMIYIMGGALEVPGNLQEMNRRIDNPYAEWNVFIDPYATNVVFSSGVPITLVPLDATNQVPLTPDYLKFFGAQAVTPAARFVLAALRRIYPLLGKRKFYFWDPITAVIATHNEIAEFRNATLCIVQDEGSQYGRIMEADGGVKTRICTRIDGKAFEHIFLNTLNGQAS